jgi:hypothetical protein
MNIRAEKTADMWNACRQFSLHKVFVVIRKQCAIN